MRISVFVKSQSRPALVTLCCNASPCARRRPQFTQAYVCSAISSSGQRGLPDACPPLSLYPPHDRPRRSQAQRSWLLRDVHLPKGQRICHGERVRVMLRVKSYSSCVHDCSPSSAWNLVYLCYPSALKRCCAGEPRGGCETSTVTSYGLGYCFEIWSNSSMILRSLSSVVCAWSGSGSDFGRRMGSISFSWVLGTFGRRTQSANDATFRIGRFCLRGHGCVTLIVIFYGSSALAQRDYCFVNHCDGASASLTVMMQLKMGIDGDHDHAQFLCRDHSHRHGLVHVPWAHSYPGHIGHATAGSDRQVNENGPGLGSRRHDLPYHNHDHPVRALSLVGCRNALPVLDGRVPSFGRSHGRGGLRSHVVGGCHPWCGQLQPR